MQPMHPQKGTIAPTMRTLHCVYTRRLSEKVLTAMQFSINGKARQFETSAELSKILAEYRFVPIPIRTRQFKKAPNIPTRDKHKAKSLPSCHVHGI